MWKVEDFVAEYASQIEGHVNRLLKTIQMHHWRTNPSIFAGMRIAVLRKQTPTPTPTIVVGLCVDATPGTGYSKIRVAFDVEKTKTLFSSMPPKERSIETYPQSPRMLHPVSHELTSPRRDASGPRPSSAINNDPQIFVGDIGEPFLVQMSKEGSTWSEPDEIFVQDSKKLITMSDKRIFWEMIRTLIELPQIASHCKTGIRNTRDLVSILKKTENRILFTVDGPECLPKDAALELLASAFVIPGPSHEPPKM